MSYKITITSDARAEYIAAYIWYEEQRKGLGEEFYLSVEKKIALIATNPQLFSGRHKKFREVLIDKTFPYKIVYHIDIKNESIIVSSIFHTSRKPKKKYRKL